MPREIKYTNIGADEIPTTAQVATKYSDRTLSYVYGPEHQRIKEVIQLSGNGTSSYTAGTTWYLNGEDSQGLSYEKEIKDSGVTEHRHYLSAGGMNFALVIARTGTGVTATSTDKLAQTQVCKCVPNNCCRGSIDGELHAKSGWADRSL
jgi:hypothetical protein